MKSMLASILALTAFAVTGAQAAEPKHGGILKMYHRETPGGIALLEVKGNQLWGKPEEVEKATARHTDYGPVFMVGRERGQSAFTHLRKLGEKLDTDGAFAVERLRYV